MIVRLVTSILGKEELSEFDVALAKEKMERVFGYEIEVQRYKYDDRKYYEVDIDMLDVEFVEENIYEKIDMLINVYEKIITNISCEIDIICANDDTETEIEIYENDNNNIETFGLFVTPRKIPGVTPYYSSNFCNAYLNFENVSFGCIFV